MREAVVKEGFNIVTVVLHSINVLGLVLAAVSVVSDTFHSKLIDWDRRTYFRRLSSR